MNNYFSKNIKNKKHLVSGFVIVWQANLIKIKKVKNNAKLNIYIIKS
jgi:hypothetical protein